MSGDLCNRLCYHSNYTVLNYIQENKVVLVIRFGGQKLVLKSESPNFATFQQLPDGIAESEYLDKLREVNDIFMIIKGVHELEVMWNKLKRVARNAQAKH